MFGAGIVMRRPKALQLTVADQNTTEAFSPGYSDAGAGLSRSGRAPGDLIVKHDDGVVFVEEEAVIRAHPLLEERLTSYRRVGDLHFR
jgi:hypothetical protein